MKKIIFIRHGSPKGKFKNYSKLSFEYLNNLLIGSVSPNLDFENNIEKIKNLPFIKDTEFIFYSGEIRAKETAELISELAKVESEENNLLREIEFFNGIIERDDVNKHDFNHVRSKVITQFFNSCFSENFEHVKKRFIDFLEFLRARKEQTIICVTHGWFMRLIYVYSLKGHLNDVSLEDLLNARIHGFLEYIEVSI